MILNTELKDILKPIEKYVNTKYKKNIDECYSICMYIKTPHIFYRKQVVYCEKLCLDGTNKIDDITELLENNLSFNMDNIKEISSKAYMDYFTHYQTSFNKPFYKLIFKKEGYKFKLTGVDEVDSPDPIDKDNIQIRK
jgi:hypothetical protein